MAMSKNMKDAIDCLEGLIRNPNTTPDRKRKAKERLKELNLSKNTDDAIDCLEGLIRNPNTTPDRKRKAKQRLKELKKCY